MMTKIRNYLKVPIHIHPKIYIRDKSFYDTHHIYFLGEAPNCRYITNRTFVVKPPGNPVVAIYFHKFRLRFVLAVSVPITKQRRPIPIAGQLGNKQKRQTFQIARRNQTAYFPGFGIYFNPVMSVTTSDQQTFAFFQLLDRKRSTTDLHTVYDLAGNIHLNQFA